MKKVALVLMAIVMLTSVVLAGEENTPKTKSGDRAWLFNVEGLSNWGAGNYNGGVGGKMYISDGTAIRLSLGFANSSTTRKNLRSPIPVGQTAEEKITGTSFSVYPAILYNLASSTTIVPYIGGQVGLTWGKVDIDNPDFEANAKWNTSSTTFGLAGLLGVEWFAWTNVSVGAEYRLGFSSTSSKSETTEGGITSTTNDFTSTNFSLGSASSTALTVSVYW